MPLCICIRCEHVMDCSPEGLCEVCQLRPAELGDRQILNILQRLHQRQLQIENSYAPAPSNCRWSYSNGVYGCGHVKIRREDVEDVYRRQMAK